MNNKWKAAILLLCLLLILLLLLWPVLDGRFSGDPGSASDGTIEVDGKKYREKPLSIVLVMGIDDLGAYQESGSYNNTSQADFLALVALDHRTKTFSVLSVNRDTIVKIDEIGVTGERTGDTVTAQIALAHTYGDGGAVSCRNTVRAVSRLLLGVDVDSYVAMTMDAVGILNDAVGGVSVTMDDDYTDIDPAYVKGAAVTLNGEAALGFVRARMSAGDGTNLARMKRQKLYMQSFVDTMSAIEPDSVDVKKVYDKVAEDISSDLSLTGMSDLVSDLSEYECSGIYSLEGTTDTVTGYTRFFPNEANLKDLVLSLYYVLQ